MVKILLTTIQLWFAVLDSQVETEITATISLTSRTLEPSSVPTCALHRMKLQVCNLASISLSKFFTPADNFGGEGNFDLDKLKEISKVVLTVVEIRMLFSSQHLPNF